MYRKICVCLISIINKKYVFKWETYMCVASGISEVLTAMQCYPKATKYSGMATMHLISMRFQYDMQISFLTAFHKTL